jgi:hypothetical protein
MKRTLLLNKDYSPLTFLTERRALRFLANEIISSNKVEIMSVWDDHIKINEDYYYFPATLRLKNQIKRCFRPLIFSKRALIVRDESTCQFCNRVLNESDATVDHLIPKSKGGNTSFLNCVIACFICNNIKGNKSLNESGLKLIKQPVHPKNYNISPFNEKISCWHEDWNYWKS